MTGRLTPLERAVLDFALAGDDMMLGVLREQAATARATSREFTGVGFFTTLAVDAGVPVLVGPTAFDISDVDGSVDGLEHGIGFVIFVHGGKVTTIEAFTYDEPWPESLGQVGLSYSQGVSAGPPRFARPPSQ